MSRTAPVASVGRVNVLAPTNNDPYYRYTWTRADGKLGRTRGCRKLADALAKAAAIDAHETRAANPKSSYTLGQVAEKYLETPEGRHQKTGGPWTNSQHRQVTEKLTRMLRGREKVCVLDFNRELADAIRAQAGTPKMVRQNTSILRGYVRWGAIHGYFTTAQAETLPARCLAVAPALGGTPAPSRREAVRAVGTSERYIREEDAPSVEAIREIGDQMEA